MKEIQTLASRLLDFRQRIGADRNASTDPIWFPVNSVDSLRRPVCVMMLRGGEITGAILLREQMRYGIGLGYLFACDAAGDEFILAEEEQKEECFRLCVAALLERFPSWVLSLATQRDYGITLGPAVAHSAKQGIAKYRLTLLPSADATFAKFGAHTRRNLRYYAKKLTQSGAVFHGELSDELGQQVAAELLPKVDFPITPRLLKETIDAILRTPNHFLAGVQASDGSWMSLIAGWREGTSTKVLYQMSDRDFRKASLSLATRSFLMQHEIARKSTELAFVAYASGLLNAGFEEDPRYDLLATKSKWRLSLVMWFAEKYLHQEHRLRGLTSPASGLSHQRSMSTEGCSS